MLLRTPKEKKSAFGDLTILLKLQIIWGWRGPNQVVPAKEVGERCYDYVLCKKSMPRALRPLGGHPYNGNIHHPSSSWHSCVSNRFLGHLKTQASTRPRSSTFVLRHAPILIAQELRNLLRMGCIYSSMVACVSLFACLGGLATFPGYRFLQETYTCESEYR